MATKRAAQSNRYSTSTSAECIQEKKKKTSTTTTPCCRGLPRSFFDVDCVTLARKLLGTKLCCRLRPTSTSSDDGGFLSGRIVETEAYAGASDPSAHSYRGRTQRNEAMFMQPGTIYVYNIYGSYACVNLSSRGEGHAVLIRSVEPLDGLTLMQEHRARAKQKKNTTGSTADLKKEVPARSKAKQPKKTSSTPASAPPAVSTKDLCNGPSKLCQAFQITKSELNKADVCDSEAAMWIEECPDAAAFQVVACRRIGIEGSGPEAASLTYRFYIRGNKFVSRRDKKAEDELDAGVV